MIFDKFRSGAELPTEALPPNDSIADIVDVDANGWGHRPDGTPTSQHEIDQIHLHQDQIRDNPPNQQANNDPNYPADPPTIPTYEYTAYDDLPVPTYEDLLEPAEDDLPTVPIYEGPVDYPAYEDLVDEATTPRPNDATMNRLRSWRFPPKLTANNKRAEHAQVREDVDRVLNNLTEWSHPDIETNIEVIEEVPWIQQRIMQSKAMQPHRTLGKMFRGYGSDAFGLHEYANGEGVDDRKYQRFRVAKRLQGYVLPHIVRPDLPFPRNTTDPEHTRNDVLVMGADGESSWAGGLVSSDGSAIAVGKYIPVIGVDARAVAEKPKFKEHPLTRAKESALSYILDTLGIAHDIELRRTPNGVAKALDGLTAIYDDRDIESQIGTLKAVKKRLAALGVCALQQTLLPRKGVPNDRLPQADKVVLPPHMNKFLASRVYPDPPTPAPDFVTAPDHPSRR